MNVEWECWNAIFKPLIGACISDSDLFLVGFRILRVPN